MSDFSIAEAKSQFAQLVHQAESGRAIRITRRGRNVAVLLSQADYDRLCAPRTGWLAFSQSLRAQADSVGVRLLDDTELAGLRDNSERSSPKLR